MPFFAEKFWKPVDQSDALALAGLVLGVGSIWLSWWLARRDIKKRITEAQRGSLALLDRVTTALIQAEMGEVVRCLREVRQSVRMRGWAAALVRLDDTEHHLVRVQQSQKLTAEESAVLRRVATELPVLASAIRKLSGGPSDKDLSQPKMDLIYDLIASVAEIDTRLRDHQLGAGNAVT